MEINAIEIKRPNNAGDGKSMQRKLEREEERQRERKSKKQKAKVREQEMKPCESLEDEASEQTGHEAGWVLGNHLPSWLPEQPTTAPVTPPGKMAICFTTSS